MLHIVTLKAGPMRNKQIISFVAVFCLLAVGGCTVDKNGALTKTEKDELVFADAPEPAGGKMDVYVSMARAAKYNVDVASQNLNKKIFNQNPNLKPHDIIQNIMNTNVDDGNPLYDASRVLEYAIIYAMSNLNANRLFVENNFYMKSSQHLAMAAIRSHQDAWFASRKVKELDRLIRQEQKKVTELNRKMERLGTLGSEDLEYKKNLEVALLKLSEIQKNLAYRVVEYGQLVRVDPKDIELEGRRFYELEDFDKKYSLEIFQEAAVRNRSEFALAKELVQSYNFKDVRAYAIREYPDVARLDINGVDLNTELYNKELTDKALLIANNLVDQVTVFMTTGGSEAKKAAQRKAFDELGAAILAQIEVNYKLVQLADVDYFETSKEISALKKEIKTLEKAYRLTLEKKLELLNKKIQLVEAEQKLSQINAERAVALRSLYFNAGLSPFSKQILKAPIKDIVVILRNGFNRDLTEMLSAAKEDAAREPAPEVNDWAKQENWLEVLIDGKSKVRPAAKGKAAAVLQADKFAPYGEEADKLRTLQLGSYEQRQNALQDWDMLSERFPELKKFNPGLERSRVGGVLHYRLVVNSPKGGFRDLCNKMRSQQVECLIK